MRFPFGDHEGQRGQKHHGGGRLGAPALAQRLFLQLAGLAVVALLSLSPVPRAADEQITLKDAFKDAWTSRKQQMMSTAGALKSKLKQSMGSNG